MEDNSVAVDVGLRDAVLSGWYQAQTGELFQGLAISAADTVLDVGCGDGGSAHFCASRGASMIVTDVDATKVEATKRLLASIPAREIRAMVSDSNPLPLEDGAASVVISTEVLEHVDDPAQFLSELVRVGRSGARYLLTVPDPVCEALQKHLAHPSYFAKPNHVRVIQREEFAELVRAAGLVIERRASYGFYWSLWWLMFWTTRVDFIGARHPVLDNWARTWSALLDTPQGATVKRVLDSFMPKSQVILARKP
ncbi:Methyltransferase domain-containing protein [Rhizobiales bacterium GAS191]|nr:Methyltransferase domain-containing protein [Rhizobiales bacterium GAS191]